MGFLKLLIIMFGTIYCIRLVLNLLRVLTQRLTTQAMFDILDVISEVKVKWIFVTHSTSN